MWYGMDGTMDWWSRPIPISPPGEQEWSGDTKISTCASLEFLNESVLKWGWTVYNEPIWFQCSSHHTGGMYRPLCGCHQIPAVSPPSSKKSFLICIHADRRLPL